MGFLNSLGSKMTHLSQDRIMHNPSSPTGKIITDTNKTIASYYDRKNSPDKMNILSSYEIVPNQITLILCKNTGIQYFEYKRPSEFHSKGEGQWYNEFRDGYHGYYPTPEPCPGQGSIEIVSLINSTVEMLEALRNNPKDITKLYGSERNAVFQVLRNYQTLVTTYNSYVNALTTWVKSPKFQQKIPNIPDLEQKANSKVTQINLKTLPIYRVPTLANQNSVTTQEVQQFLTPTIIQSLLSSLSDFNKTVLKQDILSQMSLATFSAIMNNEKTVCGLDFYKALDGSSSGSGSGSGSSGSSGSSSGSSGTMSMGFSGGYGSKRKRTRKNHKKKRKSKNKSKMRKRR